MRQHRNFATGEKSRLFEVFKVPGKMCMTTDSIKKMFEEKKLQKSDINNGGFQQQSNQAAENKQYHMKYSK